MIAKLLAERGSTFIGGIPEKNRKAIVAYANNPAPSSKDWDEIHNMVVSGTGPAKTVWQAVCAIDPNFTDKTPACSDPTLKWLQVPAPFTLARALRDLLA